jgi:heme A synthase
VSLQIVLGILTVLSYVNIVVALLHQAGAIALFSITIYFIHRFRALDEKEA